MPWSRSSQSVAGVFMQSLRFYTRCGCGSEVSVTVGPKASSWTKYPRDQAEFTLNPSGVVVGCLSCKQVSLFIDCDRVLESYYSWRTQ